MQERKIIFISNAPSGTFSGIKRRLSSSNPCKLEELTKGLLTDLPQWRHFVRKLDVPTESLYKDQFTAKYPKALYKSYPSLTFPCMVERTKEAISVMLTAEEIASCASTPELMDLVTAKLVGAQK